MKRKRLAIWGVGMVSPSGTSSLPSFLLFLKNLTTTYDITVYRLSPGVVRLPFAQVRSFPSERFPDKVNYLLLMAQFVWDHIRQPYSALFALAVLPAGRIAYVLKSIFRLPLVLHLHAAETVAIPQINYGDVLKQRSKRITQKICKRSDAVVFLSSFQRQLAEATLEVKMNAFVYPRGCDPHHFPFQAKPIQSPLQLLYVGYDERVKSPEKAVLVFQHLKKAMSCSLTMIGAGLPERFSAAHPDIVFHQSVENGTMHEFLHRADVLLVTSNYEAQSSVAIEAMCCGTLVCGTHVGVIADLSGHACVTVSSGDAESIAQEIILLINDPHRQNELRENARAWANFHNDRWTLQQYVSLINSCIGK